jgi:hypothetical protein
MDNASPIITAVSFVLNTEINEQEICQRPECYLNSDECPRLRINRMTNRSRIKKILNFENRTCEKNRFSAGIHAHGVIDED